MALSFAVTAGAAHADAPADPAREVDEVIVTAQKREQAANAVGMSITSATGETMRLRGIEAVADLPRLVPGVTVQQSAFNSTSITLRGVGFFNSDLATPPAVTIYVDEVPLPYPAMTRLAAFDLDRLEVLKGPQGTLYGQNATGGAVNYIAAKPTETLQTGFDASWGRFNRTELGAFASGPLGADFKGRLAVRVRSGDPWQESLTRPDDRLGRVRELQGRGTLEWRPGARLSSRLTFTATHDGSDTLAAQFIAPNPIVPALALPGLLNFPVVTKPRSADWSTTRFDTQTPFPYASDTTLLQAAWRNDYQLRDDLTFTSLTAYAHFHQAYGQDPNGTPFTLNEVVDKGQLSALFQEWRLAGRSRRLNWLLGANAARDTIKDHPLEFFRDVDLSHVFESVDPLAFSDANQLVNHVGVRTYSAFGRTEFALNDRVTLEGALRYNVDRRTFDSCSIAPTDHFARYWNLFRGFTLPLTRPGDCFVLDATNGLKPVDNVHSTLDQNSLSWRAGVNWKPRPGLLVFANVSKGYKAGAVPVLATATTGQLTPIPEESVLGYEAGLKATLLDRAVQLNAAAFYYDYRDKQLRGAVLDPAFGPLEALVSIPRSHVEGAEAQLTARPITGLTLDTALTYVRTRIDSFTGFDALANFGNHSGTPFPFSPKWQSVTNLDYAFPIAGVMSGFVGGSLTANNKTYAGVGALPMMQIDAFTLLDLRAGVVSTRGHYRAWLWGKNVGNQYYWTNVFSNGTAISRFPGQPATWGLSLSGRF